MGEVVTYGLFIAAGGIIVLRLVIEIPPVKRWWRRKFEK